MEDVSSGSLISAPKSSAQKKKKKPFMTGRLAFVIQRKIVVILFLFPPLATLTLPSLKLEKNFISECAFSTPSTAIFFFRRTCLLYSDAMEWWQKLRRAWNFISSSLNARRIANCKCVKNKNEGIEKGLLSLRGDVETCEYQDVHVMWDILHQLQAEQATQVATTSKSIKKVLLSSVVTMITGKDIYDVLAAVVPLYVAMILAYGSVRWWKIFTPDQCSGINRFVAVFAVPLLSFHFISTNNIYAMNYHFIAADSLQKIVILGALFLWQAFSKNGNLEWMITLFSLSTLPNTLVMGIPLLTAMYGDFSGNLMVQIVVMQSVIWYTLMLFMFEYRGAKLLITDQFPETAASITSFRVESDVVSLNGREPLQADAEIGDDGKLHVVVRKSSASSMISSYNKGLHSTAMTPRASNLTGVEIYSVQSSREPTPRASSFNQTDFYAMFASKTASPKHGYTNSFGGGVGGDVFSLQSSKGPTPRTSNFEEEMLKIGKKKAGRSMSGELYNNGLPPPYPPPNPMFSGSSGPKKKESGSGAMPNKELHMFVWSSSASPVSENNLRNAVNRAASTEFGAVDSAKAALQQDIAASRGIGSPASGKGNANREIEQEDASKFPANLSPFSCQKKIDLEEGVGAKKHQMPPASVMTRLILIMVWRKLIRNPNTYSSLLGLIWSLVSFRWNIQMPTIVKGSISILSDAGLGMAMFSLGLFMALQPKIIACGKSVAAFSMAVRFLTGPAVIAATSIAIGLRGVLLHVAIVQAALPQGIVPFVFAKEYSVHPDILSTAVIFGMLIALPITILYYVLLGL